MRIVRLDRTQTLDGMVARFREGSATLPGMARDVGGRVNGGIGEYYRELMAPQRTLEQDAHGNWVPRWLEHGTTRPLRARGGLLLRGGCGRRAQAALAVAPGPGLSARTVAGIPADGHREGDARSAAPVAGNRRGRHSGAESLSSS